MQHTISILVENKFGVLTRVAGLFSGRGYNIDTLNVGPTHTPEFSRMTIVTHGDEATLEQIVKQLNKQNPRPQHAGQQAAQHQPQQKGSCRGQRF